MPWGKAWVFGDDVSHTASSSSQALAACQQGYGLALIGTWQVVVC